MQQLLPWILGSLSLALLAAAGLIALSRRKPERQRPLPTEWTLAPRPVFTSDERRVYRQLREALPHHIVLSKLPLVRFCQPVDPNEVRFWYELLGSTHVSFAVCSANGRVLAAIDLETERGSSRRATQIKQSVLGACRIRYLRCAPDHLPSVPELQLLVPQTGASARGPQPAPTAGSVRQAGDVLASTLAARRQERQQRATLWQDSGFLRDSFFDVDSRHGELGSTSGFGALRASNAVSGLSVRELKAMPADIGGVVVETPAPDTVRH